MHNIGVRDGDHGRVRRATASTGISRMNELLTSPGARAVILFAAIGMLIAVGTYIVARYRDTSKEDRPGSSELLTKFRELHSEGELSEQEFRTIKSTLSASMKAELKDADDTG